MPLHLYETLSPAPHLSHWLGEIAERHIGLHLSDSFLVLTPDDASRRDLEKALLKYPKLEGILLGKSVSTLTALLPEILFYHPHPLPIASPFQQRRALRMALSASGLPLPSGPKAERRILWELSRLENLRRLDGGAPLGGKWRQVHARWEEALEKRFRLLSPGAAWALAQDFIARGGYSPVERLQDLYLLGFLIPDAALLGFLRSVLEHHPRIRVHLSLPPAEKLMDKDGLLLGAMEHFKSWLVETRRFKDPSPGLKFRSAPTALHESRQILQAWRGPEGPGRILAPSGSDTWRFLERDFSREEGEPSSRLDPLGSAAFFRSFDLPLPEEAGAPWGFDEFFAFFLPRLTKAREQAAQNRDGYNLRYLEQAFATLREWGQSYTHIPSTLPAGDWLSEFRREMQEAPAGPPPALAKQSWLRPIDHAGLESVDTLWFAGLAEGIYPTPPAPFYLAEDFQDPLWNHEKGLALESAILLARDSAILSFPEFSLSGKAQPPALILSQTCQDRLSEAVEELPLWKERDLPYLEDNLQRERARLTGAPSPADAGDLRGLHLEAGFAQKIRDRPLAASYLDEYAKCPWRFFAKWHLKLEERVPEELEMEPRERGQFLHQFLEKSFRRWHPDFFSQQRHPPPETVQRSVEEEFGKLLRKLSVLEAYREWPPVVLIDQMNRIRRQVEGLLEEEQRLWREAPQKLFPSHLEWFFGKKGNPPLLFPLGDGREVPLSGSVDRIDLAADGGSYLIVD